MPLRLARYSRRFWAVYEDDGLLCVTVYKKGARAVIERIGRRETEGGQAPGGHEIPGNGMPSI